MSGDLISRQTALDGLKYEMKYGAEIDICGLDTAYDIIENIPSAKPERKKEKWTGDCCSCCGVSKYNYIKMVDDECGPFGTWNFCPNCGADMRGDHE